MLARSATRIVGTLCPLLGSRGPSLRVNHHLFSTSAALNKLTDFQTKKVLFEFSNLYDRDQDGVISNDDITKVKRALTEYVASSQGKVLRDESGPGFDEYWALFTEMADTDKDGRISREAWIDIWDKISSEANDHSFLSLPQWVRLMPGCFFPIIDSKGDGKLDVEEYSNFWFHVGLVPLPNRTAVQGIFDLLTEGGKKELDLNRFEELYADFYLSDDINSPGQYIAGPFPNKDIY